MIIHADQRLPRHSPYFNLRIYNEEVFQKTPSLVLDFSFRSKSKGFLGNNAVPKSG